MPKPTDPGRILPAPINHVSEEQYQAAKAARRAFLKGAGAATALAVGAGAARAQAPAAYEPPSVAPWTLGLGAPVAAKPYGTPSEYESNLQRRESPGLTRTPLSSVSFA
ncbi:MAG: hypothetical protein RL669_1017, partial [Pseudomonadota bacterium]